LYEDARMEKRGGHSGLAELDRILRELQHIKEVDVPLRPDLPRKVLQFLDRSIEKVSCWRTKAAASASPQVAGPSGWTSTTSSQQAGPTTVGSDTVQAAPVVALAMEAAEDGAALQARPDGTAEMQYLRVLYEDARMEKHEGHSGLAELDRILRELQHIKKVDVPLRPDLPRKVLRFLDRSIEKVSCWRTKAAASASPQVAGPSGWTSTASSQQAAEPAVEMECSYGEDEMEWEPTAPQLLVAEQPTWSAGPMAAPQDIPAQQVALVLAPSW
jgi:hypothetical protein